MDIEIFNPVGNVNFNFSKKTPDVDGNGCGAYELNEQALFTLVLGCYIKIKKILTMLKLFL
jgi:hypothetical protein